MEASLIEDNRSDNRGKIMMMTSFSDYDWSECAEAHPAEGSFDKAVRR